MVLIVVFLTLNGVDQSTRSIPLWTKLGRLDLPGIVVLIASVCCLFLALEQGSAHVSWSSSKPIGLFVGFGLLLIVFGAWQWKAGENATIPVHYLKDRTVVWGSLYLFWDNMASYLVSSMQEVQKDHSADAKADDLLHALLLPGSPERLASSERDQLHVARRASNGWIAGRWWHRHQVGPLCKPSLLLYRSVG